MTIRTVRVNDLNYRVGQDHHNSVLTDREVELLRELHAERAMGYRKLAKKFEISVSGVRHIIKGRWRAQVPTGTRRVHVTD